MTTVCVPLFDITHWSPMGLTILNVGLVIFVWAINKGKNTKKPRRPRQEG